MIKKWNNAKRELKSADVVLVDCFDTLIHRNISTTDIKKRWSKCISRMLNYVISAKEIFLSRLAAEKYLENKYGLTYSYLQLIDIINDLLSKSMLEDITIDVQMAENIEKEIEIETLFLDDDISCAVKELSESGKRIFLVSDYHMGKKIIKEYFSNFNFDNVFSDYYISSDCKFSKQKGGLYEYILKEIACECLNCVMIGDNYESDIINSSEHGITGIWRKYDEYPSNEGTEGIIKTLNKIYKSGDYSGYCFSLSLFTERLYKRLINLKAKDVYFLSREGEFLKKIFEIYMESINENSIRTHYLYVSRQSTFVPSLNEDFNKEEFTNLFRQFNNISLRSFLMNLGLDEKKIEFILMDISADPDKDILNFSSSNEFNLLKENKEFLNIYKEHVLNQREIFYNYMTQEGCENNDRIYIVDVGWKGTIQDNISKLYNNIYGFYLGYGEYIYGQRKNPKEGLLFSVIPYSNHWDKLWSIDAGMFEKILYASHSSTCSYKNEGDKIVPVFKEYKEEHGVYELIKPLQLEILKKCETIFETMNNSDYFMDDFENIFLDLHLRTIFSMNYNKINFRKYVEKQHFENFGIFNTVSVGNISKEFNPIKNMKYFKSRIKGIIDPFYFVQNCYHFSKIKNNLFWKLYSLVIYTIAKKRDVLND